MMRNGEMMAEAERLGRLADGYRMAGARELAGACMRAAAALRQADTACATVARLTKAAQQITKVK